MSNEYLAAGEQSKEFYDCVVSETANGNLFDSAASCFATIMLKNLQFTNFTEEQQNNFKVAKETKSFCGVLCSSITQPQDMACFVGCQLASENLQFMFNIQGKPGPTTQAATKSTSFSASQAPTKKSLRRRNQISGFEGVDQEFIQKTTSTQTSTKASIDLNDAEKHKTSTSTTAKPSVSVEGSNADEVQQKNGSSTTATPKPASQSPSTKSPPKPY